MRSVVSYLILFIAALIVAVAVPRIVSQEPHWITVWDYVISPTSGSPSLDGNEPILPVIVESDRGFAALDGETGTPIQSGIKADLHGISPFAFINQPDDAERWVLQYWSGSPPRFVDRLGRPEVDGRFLLQLDDSQTLHIQDVVENGSLAVPLPPATTVFDICDSCQETNVLTATLRGEIALHSAGGSELSLGSTLRSSFPDSVPVVYGAEWIDAGTIVLLYGRDPQWLVTVRTPAGEEDGEILHAVEIPREQSVNYGVDVVVSAATGLITVPVTGHFLLLDPLTGEASTITLGGSPDRVYAGHTDAFPVYSGAVNGGVAVTLGGDDGNRRLSWRWTGVEHAGSVHSPYRLLVRRGDRIIALGIRR